LGRSSNPAVVEEAGAGPVDVHVECHAAPAARSKGGKGRSEAVFGACRSPVVCGLGLNFSENQGIIRVLWRNPQGLSFFPDS
jgi:hypothetical protein